MAERRPDPTPEDTASEVEAWAKAFESARPEEPFTPEETERLNLMILEAVEQNDPEALEILERLADSPALFRTVMSTAPQ
jgi:N-acetylglucosamine kinase-like BadF-type ATPase